MECPRCGLENPSTAVRCDCGHDFSKANIQLEDRSEEVREQQAGLRRSSFRPGLILSVVVAMGAVGVGVVFISRADSTRWWSILGRWKLTEDRPGVSGDTGPGRPLPPDRKNRKNESVMTVSFLPPGDVRMLLPGDSETTEFRAFLRFWLLSQKCDQDSCGNGSWAQQW